MDARHHLRLCRRPSLLTVFLPLRCRSGAASTACSHKSIWPSHAGQPKTDRQRSRRRSVPDHELSQSGTQPFQRTIDVFGVGGGAHRRAHSWHSRSDAYPAIR